MQVIGLCRFSYPAEGGFQVEHETLEQREAYLYAPDRMEARFAQFEAIALPGLKAQTDPDFTLVVVIGDGLPARWRDRLDQLLKDFPQAQVQAHPPGPHRKVMQTALNAARANSADPCLQFRHDDDDAVSVDFVARLRQAANDCAGLLTRNRLVAIDFNTGYSALPSAAGLQVTGSVLPLYGVALGMAVQGGVRQSIMNFAHKKLGKFMPVVSFSDSAMFIRGLNDHNDSRQKAGIKPMELSALDAETATLFQQRFRISETEVSRVFSAL